jgi:FkbM family methyltransferase
MKLIKQLEFRASRRPKVSYSQCGEDLIVKYIFDAVGIKRPTYIDVGAYHPYYLSNTALFYLDGSMGINVEPDPDLYRRFVAQRKRDVNLNIGVAKAPGETEFYIMSVPTLNTFSRQVVKLYEAEGDYRIRSVRRVRVDTLSAVIGEYWGGRFPDFLSLDAEGGDDEILHSIDYRASAPIVICVETISFSNSGRGRKDTGIASFLASQGYMQYADTYLNTIFVKRDVWVRE